MPNTVESRDDSGDVTEAGQPEDSLRKVVLRRVLIVGCGFTGKRVAGELLRRGIETTATTRNPDGLASLRESGLRVIPLDLARSMPRDHAILVEKWDAVVYSVPTLRREEGLWEPARELLPCLAEGTPRGIYLSTTGVYGAQQRIDASTEVAPTTEREMRRFEAENACLQSFEDPLVLRPAAIYGPGRGVHNSLREGRYQLRGDGSNYISRIHVDDLANHVVAALFHRLCAAWPVADEHPCTQREMAEYCAGLLGLPIPRSAADDAVSETLRANRQVDGSEVRRKLGIVLHYPSYREGVPACLAAEGIVPQR